jgi:hypothetical protein
VGSQVKTAAIILFEIAEGQLGYFTATRRASSKLT